MSDTRRYKRESDAGDDRDTRRAGRTAPDPADDDRTRLQPEREDTADDATLIRSVPEDGADDSTRIADSGTGSGSPGEPDVGDTGGRLGVGSVLRQRFRIEGVLGEGGMGTVFSAVDLLKQEARDEQVHVALKIMKPDLVDAELTFMGLQREARRAQQLAHPNIVTVHDFDRADGHIYMTMEYLRGRPVSELLKRNRHGLEPEQARDITLQIASGLAYAHDEGIVHVDLKPQNVFVLHSGRVKILDFGIARAYQRKGSDRVEDAFTGCSPPFASPQLIEGERATPQDDVFALGIVAYALYTGRHPFDWKSSDEARAAGMRPTPHPALKRSEWRAIQAALCFDAEARPADAGEFLKRFAPSRIKHAAVAVSVGSVIAALAFVLLFQPQAGPEVSFEQLEPTLQERIRVDLDDAAQFSDLGDLDGALQLYHGVLELHPGNRDAVQGMNETVDRALERMREMRRQDSISTSAARANLESMLAYDSLPAQARERLEEAVQAL